MHPTPHDRTFRCAPVLLIGYNRSDFIEKQLDILRKAAPERLYVAVDAPKDGDRESAAANKRIRELVAAADWTTNVFTMFQERNIGCKYAVSKAITWFFENEESGIILEDDCMASLDFFRFATEMLDRYKDDERIGAVNGFSFFGSRTDCSQTYRFSIHMDVWGWASWRRVWKDYDVELYEKEELVSAAIRSSTMTAYFKKLSLDYIGRLRNSLSTWDVQLQMLFFIKRYLSIVPSERLVVNIGLSDERATHTSGYNYWARSWKTFGSLDEPIVHPGRVEQDLKTDNLRERMEGAILPRILSLVGSRFPRLRKRCERLGAALERGMPFLFRF